MSGTKPTPGVTITLTGDASDSVVTDANGEFSFDLPDGSYVLTPSLAGHQFSPASTNVEVSGADDTDNDFTAEGVYTISGTITGDVVEGVTITLTGDASDSTTTAADGTYSFSGLVDGDYNVEPSLEGYTFAPASINVTIVAANQTDQDFVSEPSLLSLPYERNFEDQVAPSYAAAEWSLVNAAYTSPISLDVTPSINSFDPSSIGYDYALKHGPGNHAYKWTDYTLPGAVNASAGVRISLIVGHPNPVEWYHSGMALLSVDESHNAVDGIHSYIQHGPVHWSWSYTAGVQTNHQNSAWVGNFSPQYDWCYYALRLEFPANGSGTLSNQVVQLAGNPLVKQYRVATQAISVDVSGWANLDTFRIISQPRYDIGYYHYPMLWIGSLTDDWPV